MVYEVIMVRWKGLEPPTFWFVAKHSIQLSYQRIRASEPANTHGTLAAARCRN